MGATTTGLVAAHGAIEELCDAGLPAQELIVEVSTRVERVLPADGVFWAATDPQTTLCMGSGMVRGLPDSMCEPIWDYEFLVPDYNKFADLARGPQRAADLHTSTGGRPERSARYRDFQSRTGLDHELRAAFTADDGCWGVAMLMRDGATRFTADDVSFLEAIGPSVARGLRSSLLSSSATVPDSQGPAIMMFDEDSQLLSVSDGAEAWLEQFMHLGGRPTKLGLPMPIQVYAVVARARAVAGGQEPGPARARIRTNRGTWLIAHASCLRGADGTPGHTALVIEPAKASEVAPIIAEAYELSARELEVVRLVSRGLGTGEIAAELVISPHTVRDHVKSLFEKVGVSSRGELVAKLFADHYSPALSDAVGH